MRIALKIAKTLPSKDGLVRKVEVLIGSHELDKKGRRANELSLLERPVQKLILIQPAQTETEDHPLSQQ